MSGKHILRNDQGFPTHFFDAGDPVPAAAVSITDIAWAAYCADPDGHRFDASGNLVPRPQAEVLAEHKAAALTRLDHLASRKAALTALLALDIGAARTQVLAANSPAQLAAALSNLPEW